MTQERKVGEPVSRNEALFKMYELVASGHIADTPSQPVQGSAAHRTVFVPALKAELK